MAALPFWRRAANIIYRGIAWIFRTFRRAVTLLAAMLLVVSAFSDLVSPTVWVVASYLGLIFPIILLFCLLWTILMLVMRRWRLVTIMLLAMLCCCTRIWRYVPLHLSHPQAITEIDGNAIEGIDTLSVLTFNTRATGDAHLEKSTNPVPVIDLIRDSGADIVCLQEYTYSLNGGHTEKQLRDMLSKEYPYYHHLLNSGRNNMGITLFSKWPITKHQKIDKSLDDYCWAFYCELDVRGRKVGLVNCHLLSNTVPKADRALYKKQIEHFDKDSLVRMEDGLRHIGPAFRRRAKQTGIINRYLADREEQADMPLIVCGDFNDTPVSFTYRSVRGLMSDAWEDAGLGPGITYREPPFWFRIDHVFHSGHFHTLEAKVLRDVTCSDHYPVLVKFQLLPVSK